ncbi:hypothetical protein D3Z58_09115 [Clostridiaceae bacterium]|nr:hypothetical protein [Clostridiaceae bacterium]
MRAKIGKKINQFLPYFFARFYRCIGVKNGFGEDLEKNGRQKRRVWGKGPVAKYGTKCRVKKRNIHSREIPANGYGTD